MNDNIERGALPSASAVERLMQCAASHQMGIEARGFAQEASAHEEGSKGGEWADKGSAMHDAIFEQSSAGLASDQERQDYSKIVRKLREFLSGWGAQNEDSIIREERMWLHRGIEPIFSGRPDYIRISPQGKRAAIVDFKSLWNKAPEPQGNDQLWSQAVLLAAEQPQVEEFVLMLISPHYGYRPYLASRSEVEAYEVRLRALLERIEERTEPVTGDWCKYCPGLLICPKIKAEAAMKIEHPSELKLEDAGKLLARCERLEKYAKEVKAYYTLVIFKDPDAVPGWKILEKSMRTLKDPMKLMDAVAPIIGLKAFWGAVSVSITKLESAWKGDGEAVPVQPASEVLAPFITIRKQEPSLTRIKGR